MRCLDACTPPRLASFAAPKVVRTDIKALLAYTAALQKGTARSGSSVAS